MARRSVRRYVVRNSVFAVRLRGSDEWRVTTVATADADHSYERRLWNGRGYETRVSYETVETTYPSPDAVPVEEVGKIRRAVDRAAGYCSREKAIDLVAMNSRYSIAQVRTAAA